MPPLLPMPPASDSDTSFMSTPSPPYAVPLLPRLLLRPLSCWLKLSADRDRDMPLVGDERPVLSPDRLPPTASKSDRVPMIVFSTTRPRLSYCGHWSAATGTGAVPAARSPATSSRSILRATVMCFFPPDVPGSPPRGPPPPGE